MERTQQHIFLLFALLLFYALGPSVILVWSLGALSVAPGGNLEEPTLLKVLATFASDPGAYTGVLHQMIVPVAAAVTAANARAVMAHKWSRWLFIIPLATIFVCLSDALIISSTLVGAEVADVLGPVSPGAISQVFLSAAGTLATYVMLLVGLQAASPNPPPDHDVVLQEPDDEHRGSVDWMEQRLDQLPTSHSPTISSASRGVG